MMILQTHIQGCGKYSPWESALVPETATAAAATVSPHAAACAQSVVPGTMSYYPFD